MPTSPQVTADALDHALATLGIDDPPLRARLLAAYRHLAPFADVGPALRRLREQGMRTAILSNGTTAMLAEGVAAAGIADLVDPVLSVDEVGMFKPAPEVYRLATSRLGLPAAAIAFVSANGWDVHGAASFGLRSVWVNRGRLADDRLPGAAIAVIDDLAALPALLGAGVGLAAMMAELPVRFADVAAAADRLRGVAAETPLLESEALNELVGGRLLIKPEPLQRTGSFKFRGAYNAISTLRPPAVVAYSSGNHAQGVAMAARAPGHAGHDRDAGRRAAHQARRHARARRRGDHLRPLRRRPRGHRPRGCRCAPAPC